jgi:phosphonatase-like hydrolase
MIELVVFDMAGTTVHDGDAVSTCFRAALASVGVFPEPDAVNAVMGFHKPEAIRRLLSTRHDTPRPLGEGPGVKAIGDREVDAIHADFVARMLHYYETDPAVREIAGASKVFAELRRAGIKVALNTGFGRTIVDMILRRLQWTGAVDAVIASDEAARGRPHPDMIRLLMARFGVTQAQHVAKVGDTPVDLEEGFNAGCGLVVGVTTGSFTRRQLEAYPGARIVDSVADVPAIQSLAFALRNP